MSNGNVSNRSRRGFLAEVGRGMLVSSLGATTALELGLSSALASNDDTRVTFGKLEPLVSLMQETPPEALLPLLVKKLHAGVSLKELAAAGALANVRAFAGQDYTGYHTFMAIVPSLQMAAQLPRDRQPLPVLKVLYRNSSRIQTQGADHHDALHPIVAQPLAATAPSGERLRNAVRSIDWNGAERSS